MHELSLATSLVEQVENILKERDFRKVITVSVSMGKFSGVERESFEFCFPLVCEGTLVEGAKLEVVEVPVTLECQSCSKKTVIEEPVLVCGSCGSSSVQIVAGREFVISSLEVE